MIGDTNRGLGFNRKNTKQLERPFLTYRPI